LSKLTEAGGKSFSCYLLYRGFKLKEKLRIVRLETKGVNSFVIQQDQCFLFPIDPNPSALRQFPKQPLDSHGILVRLFTSIHIIRPVKARSTIRKEYGLVVPKLSTKRILEAFAQGSFNAVENEIQKVSLLTARSLSLSTAKN